MLSFLKRGEREHPHLIRTAHQFFLEIFRRPHRTLQFIFLGQCIKTILGFQVANFAFYVILQFPLEERKKKKGGFASQSSIFVLFCSYLSKTCTLDPCGVILKTWFLRVKELTNLTQF